MTPERVFTAMADMIRRFPALEVRFPSPQRLRVGHRQRGGGRPGGRGVGPLHRQLPRRAGRQRLSGGGGGQSARPARLGSEHRRDPSGPGQRAGGLLLGQAHRRQRPDRRRGRLHPDGRNPRRRRQQGKPLPHAPEPGALRAQPQVRPGQARRQGIPGSRIWSASTSASRRRISKRCSSASWSSGTPRRPSPRRICPSSSPRSWRARTTITSELLSCTVNSSLDLQSTASLRIRLLGETFVAAGSGNGGFDAFNVALTKVLKKEGPRPAQAAGLRGPNPQGRPHRRPHRVRHHLGLGRGEVRTRGVHYNQVFAAITATLRMLNLLIQRSLQERSSAGSAWLSRSAGLSDIWWFFSANRLKLLRASLGSCPGAGRFRQLELLGRLHEPGKGRLRLLHRTWPSP